jgi:hypothetical protein
MQQMQFWIFWSILAAFIVCGCILHAETDEKATNGNFAASGVGRTSARLFRSRRREGR